jgi:hypothetical protein
VARAADVTAQVSGYRLHGTMSLTTSAGPLSMSMDGVIDRRSRTGTMVAHEAVLGQKLNLTEKFSGLTFYMQAANMPELKQLAAGKPWVKFDMSRLLGAMGMSALPMGGTDPSQFVDYLRAVDASTRRVGTATVGGVSTTRYHAVINLDHYANLVPAAQRAAAQRSVRSLEQVVGSHTLPMDVWIDGHRLVRRIGLSFTECVANQHLHLAMSVDLFGYGPQSAIVLPSAGQAYDVTPLMSRAMGKVKLGCTAT